MLRIGTVSWRNVNVLVPPCAKTTGDVVADYDCTGAARDSKHVSELASTGGFIRSVQPIHNELSVSGLVGQSGGNRFCRIYSQVLKCISLKCRASSRAEKLIRGLDVIGRGEYIASHRSQTETLGHPDTFRAAGYIRGGGYDHKRSERN